MNNELTTDESIQYILLARVSTDIKKFAMKCSKCQLHNQIYKESINSHPVPVKVRVLKSNVGFSWSTEKHSNGNLMFQYR